MGGDIRHTARLRALFAAMGEAVGPGLAARERRWAGERAGSGLADALVGLAARLALAAELWLWARAGAALRGRADGDPCARGLTVHLSLHDLVLSHRAPPRL